MDEFAQALQYPSFTAFADPTIANSNIGVPYAYTQNAISQVQSSPPAMDRQSVPRPTPIPAPAGQYVRPQPSVYPVLPANPVAAPRVWVTQEYRPLPSPFSQGCLWGLLQGILAALIVLSLKKEVYFYVAIVEGFLFYMLAGFMTTRKGGKAFRGAWAGFWSGIVSTVVFWIVTAIGFAVLVTQRVQADTAVAQRRGIYTNPDQELNHALQVVGSAFPFHLATLSPGSYLIIFLAGGLLCALGFGWLGGILGKSRFRAKMQRRRYP
jgi:hypothetical protein